MDRELKLLLGKVQISRACHQKNVKILENIYNKANYDDFKNLFIRYLRKVILKKTLKSEYIDRTLDFMANFVSVVTFKEENSTASDILESTPSHPFLNDIIMETLQYHNNAIEDIRYHSCVFVRLILNYLGNQITLDNDICDTIQDAMLERTLDPKSVIRLQAIIALVRLQDPTNKDCPVINTYLSLITESNVRIRVEIVKTIAPTQLHNVATYIKDRLRDVDANVRTASFKRIADLGPRYFKIVDRQEIIKCGLFESNELAKQAFSEHLLPKWLNFFDRNFICFLNALKLDAEEADIIDMELISKKIMDIFLSFLPPEDVTKSVPVGQEKLIPLTDLSAEAVLLWNITVSHLRKSEDLEDSLEEIVPELTPFCNYIERIINELCNKIIEEYQRLDYYSMLYNLFEMVEQYDFTDEVGRKTLTQLIMKILKREKCQFRLTKKLVKIALELSNKNDDFTNVMCEVISEIRAPLVAVEVTKNKQDDMNKKFEIASMKVKLDKMQIDLETATDKQEYLQANEIKQKIAQLKKELAEFEKPEIIPVDMERTVKDDPKTTCWCLDILIALLELPEISKITAPLLTIKDTFVMPLLNSPKAEINYKVLNVLALYALLDGNLAEVLVKIICIPIITYRAVPNYVKDAVLVSIKTVADLFCLYGASVFGHTESVSECNQTRRRLYTEEDLEESRLNPNNFDLESIIDILLDMMDDDNSEINETVSLALTKLILYGFPVTPAFITRIVLKWYNPLTAKMVGNLQQLLGIMIGNYSSCVKGAKDVIAKAVIPILTSVAGAPNTSPLAEVDIDNLTHFLGTITNPDTTQADVINTHVALAHSLCHEILKKKGPQLNSYLVKMLTRLEIPSEDRSVLEELIAQAKLTLDADLGLDRFSKKHVQKFVQMLENIIELEYSQILETVTEESSETNNTESTSNTNTLTRDNVFGVEEMVENSNKNDRIPIENQNENTNIPLNKKTNQQTRSNNDTNPYSATQKSSKSDNLITNTEATSDNCESNSGQIAANIDKTHSMRKSTNDANAKVIAQKCTNDPSGEENQKTTENAIKRTRKGRRNGLSEKEKSSEDNSLSSSGSLVEDSNKKRVKALTVKSGKRKRNQRHMKTGTVDKSASLSSNESENESKKNRVSPKNSQTQSTIEHKKLPKQKDSPEEEKRSEGNTHSSSDCEIEKILKASGVKRKRNRRHGKKGVNDKFANESSNESEVEHKRQRVSPDRRKTKKISEMVIKVKKFTPRTIHSKIMRSGLSLGGTTNNYTLNNNSKLLPIGESTRLNSQIDMGITTSKSLYQNTPPSTRRSGLIRKSQEGQVHSKTDSGSGDRRNSEGTNTSKLVLESSPLSARRNRNAQTSQDENEIHSKKGNNTRRNRNARILQDENEVNSEKDKDKREVVNDNLKISNRLKEKRNSEGNNTSKLVPQSSPSTRRNGNSRNSQDWNEVTCEKDKREKEKNNDNNLKISNRLRSKGNCEGTITSELVLQSTPLCSRRNDISSADKNASIKNNTKKGSNGNLELPNKLRENKNAGNKISVMNGYRTRSSPHTNENNRANDHVNTKDKKEKRNALTKDQNQIDYKSPRLKEKRNNGIANKLKAKENSSHRLNEVSKNSKQPERSKIKNGKISKNFTKGGNRLKNKQYSLDRISEVSSRESTRSSLRTKNSMHSENFNDSGDTTLHTILHDVSYAGSLLNTSDLSDFSSPKSFNSSNTSRSSLRIKSIKKAASRSIPHLKHGTRFRKK